MNKKVVTEAGRYQMPQDNSEQLARVLSLLIARDGVLRTDERHIKWTLEPLVSSGVVRQNLSGTTATFVVGPDFERFLLGWVDSFSDKKHSHLIKEYREYLIRIQEKHGHPSSQVFDTFTHLISSDDKFVYLAGILGEVSQQVESLLKHTTALEAHINELDFAISVIENADEGSDS